MCGYMNLRLFKLTRFVLHVLMTFDAKQCCQYLAGVSDGSANILLHQRDNAYKSSIHHFLS